MKKVTLILAVLVAIGSAPAHAQGGTTSANIFPASTGQDLGNPVQRWDLFAQDVEISGRLTCNGQSCLAGQTITESDVQNLVTDLAGKAPLSHTHPFTAITSAPTTLSGYGILDAVPSTRTIAGKALSGNITIASADLSDASAVQTRQLTFIQGCDTCSALADTDDQGDIWINRLGRSVTIQEVFCKSDAGTPSISILNAASTVTTITCSASGVTGTLANTSVSSGASLNFQTATAGGTAKRVTVTVTYK